MIYLSNTSKKILSGIIAAVLFILFFLFAIGILRFHKTNKIVNENAQFIANLGVGYNLGNALDVCDWNTMFTNVYDNDTELLWGGAVTSKEFIQQLADDGFGVIRVPVTYMNHIDSEGNVNEAWLKRIHEVSEWIIDSGMYCIIDIHHDTGNGGWIKASNENYKMNQAIVSKMIDQIACYMNDFDDHLILEGFNEMVDDDNHWSRVPYSSLMTFNKWNQLFVNIVRASGGNNASRYLLINTYAATTNSRNIYYFELPKDSVENKLIVGVHNYSGIEGLEDSFKKIKILSDRGYPIIIGEFGSTSDASFDRVAHADEYIKLCLKFGFCPIWWDNNEDPKNHEATSFSLYDRNNCQAYFPEIISALCSSYE